MQMHKFVKKTKQKYLYLQEILYYICTCTYKSTYSRKWKIKSYTNNAQSL